MADKSQNAATIGDEPFQIFKKFGEHVMVAVAEERAMAVPLMLDREEGIDVIVLDDAFQHRRIRPTFQILLTDYSKPFFKDVLLPAGRLRESRRGASRADAIVVTKVTDHVGDEEMMQIEDEIRRYSPAPVFYSTINYGEPIPFGDAAGPLKGDVVLLSGIANDKGFVAYVKKHFTVVDYHKFPDHHAYKREEIAKIAAQAGELKASVLCTEKDFVKIETFSTELKGSSFFYLPIIAEFIKNGKEFDEMVLNVVRARHH